jgi:hypothetical protein
MLNPGRLRLDTPRHAWAESEFALRSSQATLSPLPHHARDLPANQDLRDLEQAMEAFARTQEDEGDE